MAAKERAAQVKTAREELERRHLAGAGGKEITLGWTRFVDTLLSELIEPLGDKSSFALLALGGYGREELNPYSDIDLLFLYEKEVGKSGQSIPGRVIPTLWDIGFKVGHATRTIADCLQIAAHDTISRTSMMEGRYLLGNRELYDLFTRRFKVKVVGKRTDLYLKEKRQETELRHGRFHHTLFLTEPDLKESPGGLRDYHTARWMAAARYDVSTVTEMVDRGLVRRREADRIAVSLDLMLRLRNDLHFHLNGPHDTLDYGLQPGVARRLGYGEEQGPAVVNMMRKYYRAADTIHRFGKSVTEQAIRYRPSIKHIFTRLRRHQELAPSVFAGPDEIYVKEMTARQMADSPKVVLKILMLLAEKSLKPSHGLRGMLEKVGRLWKQEKPKNFDEAISGFRELLRTPDPVDALRLMRDARLLTAVIPEFYSIRFLTPFDLYHKFTVDDHSFLAIRELDNLKRNETSGCDMLRPLYEQEERKDLLRLAILLHDLGKGDGSHSHKVAIDPAIVKRLGYTDEETHYVCDLISMHLAMSVISQRRDMHSAGTIQEFCNTVRDEKMAKRLYMLTFADISAVGPGVWNSWKADLLRELYAKSVALFNGGDPAEVMTHGRTLPHEKLTEEQRGFLNGMPDRYFRLRAQKEMEEDAALFESYRKEKKPAAVRHSITPGTGVGTLSVITTDKTGVLYKLVGTLASKNVDILSAQILTHGEKIAVDFFKVNGPGGKPITDEPFWQRVEKEIENVVSGEKRVEELMQSRKKLMVTPQNLPTIDTTVRLLNDVSPDHTVIETTSRDRLGLLYDITRALGQAGIDIVSALISTEGHRAMNTFYVTERGGKKISNQDRIAQIKHELLQLLSRGAL